MGSISSTGKKDRLSVQWDKNPGNDVLFSDIYKFLLQHNTVILPDWIEWI